MVEVVFDQINWSINLGEFTRFFIEPAPKVDQIKEINNYLDYVLLYQLASALQLALSKQNLNFNFLCWNSEAYDSVKALSEAFSANQSQSDMWAWSTHSSKTSMHSSLRPCNRVFLSFCFAV